MAIHFPDAVSTVQAAKRLRTMVLSMALVAAVSATSPARADAYADGLSAFQRGDYATARSLWEPLAKADHPRAQANLGALYAGGLGVALDPAEAVRWFRRAAEQGDAMAQTNLGSMYVNGLGVAADLSEAMKLYRMAAAQGNAEAQFNIGSMYEKGQGVAPDLVEALTWYRLAAKQKLASAQGNIGAMYAQGRGVQQDYVTAYLWFNLAVNSATHPAIRETQEANRRLAVSLMTSEQADEARNRARTWTPPLP